MPRFLCLVIVFGIGGLSAAETSTDLVQGISPYQVFQRKGLAADIPFITKAEGKLTATVTSASSGTVVRKDWSLPALSAAAQFHSLSIPAVPVGGEYTVSFECGNRSQKIEHVLVGEIWLVGGQSNAVGTEHDPETPTSVVHYFVRGRWQEGKDPLFPGFFPLESGKAYVPAWRRAGQEYYDRTGIPVGMMGWAFGGVPMSRFWDPEYRDMPDFKDLVAKHAIGATTYLWYQGESDANPEGIPVYKDRLTSMASTIRRYAHNPELVMVVVQLSYFVELRGGTPYFGRLREAQREFCESDPRSVLIPALPYSHLDPIHLDFEGYGALGRRIGECLAEIHRTGKVIWQGPRIVFAMFDTPDRTRIRVRYENAGKLVLLDKPLGVPDGPTTRSPTLDWYVSDAEHQGYAEITSSSISNGRLFVAVAGASLDASSAAMRPTSADLPLLKTGYLQPSGIRVEGLSLLLDFPMSVGADVKLSYALMSGSLCTLVDELGRPAASFADVHVGP